MLRLNTSTCIRHILVVLIPNGILYLWIWMQWSIAFSSAFYRGRVKHLWVVFSFQCYRCDTDIYELSLGETFSRGGIYNNQSSMPPNIPTGSILTKLGPKHPWVLFVCLGIFVPLEKCSIIYGNVTITGEGLQILTYIRHLLPLSSEDSLECHTCCDTAYPLIMVISEDPWHSHLLPSVYILWQSWYSPHVY